MYLGIFADEALAACMVDAARIWENRGLEGLGDLNFPSTDYPAYLVEDIVGWSAQRLFTFTNNRGLISRGL